MKKILFIALIFISFCSYGQATDSTKIQPISGYGFGWERGIFKKFLAMPYANTDTTNKNPGQIKLFNNVPYWVGTDNIYHSFGGSSSSVNIYNSDGTLTGDREVKLGGYDLLFDSGRHFSVSLPDDDATAINLVGSQGGNGYQLILGYDSQYDGGGADLKAGEGGAQVLLHSNGGTLQGQGTNGLSGILTFSLAGVQTIAGGGWDSINYSGATLNVLDSTIYIQAKNGVLLPKLTKAQRDLMNNPEERTLIYQTDNTPGFYYYNGAAWVALSGASSIAIPATEVVVGTGTGVTSYSGLTYDGDGLTVKNNGGQRSLYTTPSLDFGAGDVDDAFDGNKFIVTAGDNSAYFDNLDHNGKFGINTTTPTVALDVVGNTRVLGSFNINTIGAITNIFSTSTTAVNIGDFNGDVNGTYVIVDDAAEQNFFKANNGNVFNGDILPETDSAFDLGSSSKRFKDLWLTGGTAHIGNANISDSGYAAGKVLQGSNSGKATWVTPTIADASLTQTGAVTASNTAQSMLGQKNWFSTTDTTFTIHTATTLRSYSTSLGLQRWYVNDGSSEVGSIAYTTPVSTPGIIFLNSTNTGRSQIRQYSDTGGIAIGSESTGSSFTGNSFVMLNNGHAFFTGSPTGGAVTDAGFILDVSGTARFTSSITGVTESLSDNSTKVATTAWVKGQGYGTGAGTVTSVSFTGGLISVANPTTTPAFTVAGTSGGIPYFSSTSTWASSGLLAANALMIGGGAGTAPSTTTTGTGVLTALGVNVGSAGAFQLNNGSGTGLTGVALLASANTFSVNGAASTPAINQTGNPYTAGTATTNYPLFYQNGGTAPTTWSTAGTYQGINAVSGFTGNLVDYHVNGGASVFKIAYNGVITATTNNSSFATVLNTGLTTTSGQGGNNIYVTFKSNAGTTFFTVREITSSVLNPTFNFTGTQTMSSSYADAIYASYNPTLIAAANNQVINTIDVDPTFTNGAFTGVVNNLMNLRQSAVSKFKVASDGTATLTGNMVFSTAGKGIQYQSGTGARAANATLVAGTVTVTNTTVTANTVITLTRKTAGGVLGNLTYTLSAGASFTINSDNALDTSVVTYVLSEVN